MRLTAPRTAVTRSAAVLALTLLGTTACGAASEPAAEVPAASGSPAAATPEVLSTLADLSDQYEGGNARRAMDQLPGDPDVRFTDASGKGRPVENPEEWQICTAHQLGGDSRLVFEFGVVPLDEKC
ncbi:hypothetical protein [Streptomyces fragilis]|uniref:Lipoprotein n=1 Tax=Streptomyces fragilis TaxID=67301 RepID=A0ABV2YGB3_9ACTN|nr:hypothetical protein [Streptomyces fragilis]